MKKTMFAVLDAASNAFGNPFCSNHLGEAVRAFTDQVNRADDSNFLNKYPEHFALYEVGSYDDTTGTVTGLDLPCLITQAASVKNPVRE